MAILLLQRLLRGRSIQNQMYEGVMRRRKLINELVEPLVDSTSALDEPDEQEIRVFHPNRVIV